MNKQSIPSIQQIHFLDTGYCLAVEAMMLRGGRWRVRRIHSIAVLLRHPVHGWILWDTGYAPRFCSMTLNWPFILYRLMTPVRIRARDAVVSQLAGLGLGPADIKQIIISHMHSDHIAGLRDFPRSRFIVTNSAFENAIVRQGFNALRRALVPALIPEDFAARCTRLPRFDGPPIGCSGAGPLDPPILGANSPLDPPIPGANSPLDPPILGEKSPLDPPILGATQPGSGAYRSYRSHPTYSFPIAVDAHAGSGPRPFRDAGLGPAYDLFQDGSLLLVELPGHARGQVGMLASLEDRRFFFAADSCYYTQSVRDRRRPHPATNAFVDDPAAVGPTIDKLHEFAIANPDVIIVPTHCPEAFRTHVGKAP